MQLSVPVLFEAKALVALLGLKGERTRSATAAVESSMA